MTALGTAFAAETNVVDISGAEANLVDIFGAETYLVDSFWGWILFSRYTVPNVIHFQRYNMKCSGDNMILRGIVHEVSCFPLHFMLYPGNLDCFSDSVDFGAESYLVDSFWGWILFSR